MKRTLLLLLLCSCGQGEIDLVRTLESYGYSDVHLGEEILTCNPGAHFTGMREGFPQSGRICCDGDKCDVLSYRVQP